MQKSSLYRNAFYTGYNSNGFICSSFNAFYCIFRTQDKHSYKVQLYLEHWQHIVNAPVISQSSLCMMRTTRNLNSLALLVVPPFLDFLPQVFTWPFFPWVFFFCIIHKGLSERGTTPTCSLFKLHTISCPPSSHAGNFFHACLTFFPPQMFPLSFSEFVPFSPPSQQ